MKEEKKQETYKEIVVLDEGMDIKSLDGTRGICCIAAVFYIRG